MTVLCWEVRVLPPSLWCSTVPPQRVVWWGPGVGWKDYFKRDGLSSGLVP